MAVVNAQTTGFQSNAYQGKQVWLDYVQEIYNKKAYFKPGRNSNGSISVTADGQALTYWVLPAHGVTTGALGGLHTPEAGQIRGLKAKKIEMLQGEIIDVLIPAAAKLAGSNTVEMIFAENAVVAANRINEAFVSAVETGAKAIDAAGKVTGDSGFGTALAYDATKPFESITALKAAFNKKNAKFAYKATSMLVSSTVYADLQAKNLLIYKSIGGDEVYTFLGLDVTEVPELTCDVVMFHRDGVYGAQNLNFIVENENDPAVPSGLSIKGEIGHAEGITDMGEAFTGCLVVKE